MNSEVHPVCSILKTQIPSKKDGAKEWIVSGTYPSSGGVG